MSIIQSHILSLNDGRPGNYIPYINKEMFTFQIILEFL